MKILPHFFKQDGLNERQQNLYETLEFLSKLLFAGIFFQAILFIYPDTTGIQSLLATISATLTDPFLKASLGHSGIKVTAGNVNYVISQDCIGWKSVSAFTALIFASSDRFRDHIKPLVAGSLLILLANIFRIVTTIALSHRGLISFNVIHDFLWKWSLTFIVFLLWIIWYEDLITPEDLSWKGLSDKIRF
ncbi:MAG: exosortase/archaeosortase family protein [Candidatus Nanohalobium sp.]